MKIFVFTNGFALPSRESSQYDNENGIYHDNTSYGREYKIVNLDGTAVSDFSYHDDKKLFFFYQGLDTVDIKRLSYEKPLEGYEPTVDGLKSIDVETYEKLTPSFQKKYKKIKGEEVVVEFDPHVELTDFHQPFDLEVYMAENEHTVKQAERVLDSYNSYRNTGIKLEPGMQNFKIVTPSPVLTVKTLELLHEKRQSRIGMQWKVTFNDDTSTFRGDNSRIHVEYFETAWDGKHRKNYHQKKNGGYYADGRHSLVPDYPSVASSVTLLARDMVNIPFDDCKNNDDVLAVIEKVYETLFVNHD